jgi:hypothetical protein
LPPAPSRATRRRALAALAATVPFLLVAAAFSYYGQLHRKQSGDTYGTVYTAVALVERQTIWLDAYVPYIQERSGERPYMLTAGPGGHTITATPTASSALALPAVAAFSAAGIDSGDFDAWLEAAMLTAAVTAAASVAVLFLLLCRLTTRPRAALVAATYAWGTLTWGVTGQALWQHAGAALATTLLLLALVARRHALAGAAAGALGAFRLSTVLLAVLLLPLLGRERRAWWRFALGLAPYVLALAAFNVVAFGSPLEQGYGSAHVRTLLTPDLGTLAEGVPGLLVSPGRGLFVYSPVLLFAVVGAVAGWRRPLYRWCAVAAAAYAVFAANSPTWHGGESFGPRRLVDALPLLAVLLVPALEAIRGTRWTWVFGALLAVSVGVQLLGTASWEEAAWYDGRDLATTSWWSPTDNELVAMLQEPGTPLRVLAMLGVLAAGVALGLLAAALRPRRAVERPG